MVAARPGPKSVLREKDQMVRQQVVGRVGKERKGEDKGRKDGKDGDALVASCAYMCGVLTF